MKNDYTPEDLYESGYTIGFREEEDNTITFWWSFESDDVFDSSDSIWDSVEDAINDARKNIIAGEEIDA